MYVHRARGEAMLPPHTATRAMFSAWCVCVCVAEWCPKSAVSKYKDTQKKKVKKYTTWTVGGGGGSQDKTIHYEKKKGSIRPEDYFSKASIIYLLHQTTKTYYTIYIEDFFCENTTGNAKQVADVAIYDSSLVCCHYLIPPEKYFRKKNLKKNTPSLRAHKAALYRLLLLPTTLNSPTRRHGSSSSSNNAIHGVLKPFHRRKILTTVQ